MQREIYNALIDWKNSPNRKPLILEGARQVGKTWILKEFGNREYSNLVYVNCDNNPLIKPLFSDFDVKRILRGLSAITTQKIEPNKTLIFFDEVQEEPAILTSLKYFYESARDYHVAVAGSLLGLQIHTGTGFPVGCVNTFTLYPLSFMEFLKADGYSDLALELESHDWERINFLLPLLTEILRQYYFTGGMPEVVKTYFETNDLNLVRQKQLEILHDYEKDISKHASKKDLQKISMVFKTIPSQLAKENKKFIYGSLRPGARAKEFEDAIQWLIDAGLVIKVPKVKKMEMPLKFYEDYSSFKLYLNDIGLLSAMAEAPAAEILVGNNAFSSYKGSLTEQFVLQQFKVAIGKNPYYYSNDNSTLEIDFVIQADNIYAVEVKAEQNLKSKSLSTTLSKNPEIQGIRFSMAGYKEQERLTNVNLAMAEEYLRQMANSNMR